MDGTGDADLVVIDIRVKGKRPSGTNDCGSGKSDVMVVVKNQGTRGADSFALRLRTGDEDDEAEDKPVGALDVGKQLEVSFNGVVLKSGERKLTATVDAKKAIAESNEDNNELKITLKCKVEDE